ncbi:MAG TPA: hypothetical protein VIH97_07065 [Candidatus Acidoferrales bacterium]
MKRAIFLFATLLLTTSYASAQANFAQSVSFAPPDFGASSSAVAALPLNSDSSSAQPTFAAAAPFASAFAPPVPLPAAPAPEPQMVQGVFEKYNYDVYGGYTFFRLYEVPGVESNMNGVNGSFVYWYRDRIGPDGEIFATYGSQPGQNSWLVFYGIGPRVRWIKPKGIDLWVHALAGGVYMTPQTPYGGQSAFAGVLGGGVDLNGHHRHMAIRIAVDGVATHFFGTFQFSPKLSAGIVYKF